MRCKKPKFSSDQDNQSRAVLQSMRAACVPQGLQAHLSIGAVQEDDLTNLRYNYVKLQDRGCQR